MKKYISPIRCINSTGTGGIPTRICDLEIEGDREYLVFKEKKIEKRINLRDFNYQVERAQEEAAHLI